MEVSCHLHWEVTFAIECYNLKCVLEVKQLEISGLVSPFFKKLFYVLKNKSQKKRGDIFGSVFFILKTIKDTKTTFF